MSSSQTQQALIEAFKWRYAVKKFDAARKIPQEDLQTLLECVRLAPSSYGMQPWKFLDIQDKSLREKLKPHAHGQSQITDASHLILFAYRTDIAETDVDAFISDVKAKRPMMPDDKLKAYRDSIVGDVVKGPRHERVPIWTSRQLYISLGVLLSAAAMLRIDACPMEGFKNEEFDEILGLSERGYASAALCALGYRAADDHYAKLPKVRFAAERVIETR